MCTHLAILAQNRIFQKKYAALRILPATNDRLYSGTKQTACRKRTKYRELLRQTELKGVKNVSPEQTEERVHNDWR